MKKYLKTLVAILVLTSLAILPFVMGGCAPTDNPDTTAAPTTTVAVAHEHCVCGGSGVDDACDHASAEWTAWDGSRITEPGTYYLYLTEDLDAKNQVNFGELEGGTEITLNICLNGFNWTSASRCLSVMPDVTVNLVNCQHEAGEAKVTGLGDKYSNIGGVVMIEQGGTFGLFKGVNLVADNSDNRMQLGGTVQITGIMNMYGGTVTGCEVKRALKDDGAPDTATGQGGAIRISTDAVLNMYDGVITDGVACTGGNIRMEAGSSFNMYGGTITNGGAKSLAYSGGTSGGNGGGVFVEGSTMNMYGGTITGNSCDNIGGGLIVNGPGTLNMSGKASITGNHSNNAVNGGGVHFSAAATTLTVKDSVVIADNTNASGTSNAYLFADWLLNVNGELTGDAKIGITLAAGEGTFTDLEAPAEAFFSDLDTYTVEANADGTLALALAQ